MTGSKWQRNDVIVLAVAVALGVWLSWLAVHEPLAGENAGYRMFMARVPVLRYGNRVWLPFLQVQLWLYWLAKLPAQGAKLISMVYTLVGLASLGLYWRRVLGESAAALGLAVLAMVSFALQPLMGLGIDLMQEPMAFGLMFFVIYLASVDVPQGKVLPWVALLAGCAALATRDTAWVYLAAVTAVDWRNAPWRGVRGEFYWRLWSVPVLWMVVGVPALYVVGYHHWPSIPSEWPLMYNPSPELPPTFQDTMESLWLGLLRSGTLWVAGGTIAAALLVVAGYRSRWWEPFKGDAFAALVLRASGLSMVLVYGALLATDPWQETPGNARQGWPLLEVALVAAPLLLRAAWSAAAAQWLRVAATLAVVVGLAGGMTTTQRGDRGRPNAEIAKDLAGLQTLLDRVGQGQPVKVCITSELQTRAYAELNWVMFYHREVVVAPSQRVPQDCPVLVIEDALHLTPPAPFEKRGQIQTTRRVWSYWERPVTAVR